MKTFNTLRGYFNHTGEIASVLGVSTRTVQRCLKGDRRFSIVEKRKLSDYIGVSIDELFT